jgi:hypothetical protein
MVITYAPPPPEGAPEDPYTTYLKRGQNFVCTYCGGIDFYDGPSGGMSTNKLCANEACRHKFNYTAFINRVDDLRSTWERRLED